MDKVVCGVIIILINFFMGQLARKALNLLPNIDMKRYSVWSNQITALISKLFSLVILLILK